MAVPMTLAIQLDQNHKNQLPVLVSQELKKKYLRILINIKAKIDNKIPLNDTKPFVL